MASSNPMRSLYARLAALGAPKPFVKQNLLPSWWDDNAAAEPSVLLEAQMLISRALGVDLASLRGSQTAVLAPSVPCKFKKAGKTTSDDLLISRTLATQVAKFAALGVHAKPAPLATLSAAQIRRDILKSGAPWIDLERLLDYCWNAGIPVLHISTFPRGSKKMEGLSANIDGRPAIVISKDQKQPAWLLFILAHELGHLCLGHVPLNEVLLDEQVDQDSVDSEEAAANEFALELLCGDAPKMQIAGPVNPERLADSAARYGRSNKVYPGHAVLNYTHRNGGGFASANVALGLLEPGSDAVAVMQGKTRQNLDWAALPADAAQFVSRMTRSGASTD